MTERSRLRLRCALQKRSPLSDSFPAGSQAAARDLADFAAPLILARVLRAAVRLVRPEKKPKGIRRSISESGMADTPLAFVSSFLSPRKAGSVTAI